MQFRVLGPLEVLRDGRAVDVRGSKRRSVLALLVLHANEVVRRDRLIEELWGERVPANAAGALQNHVSRLRKDLGADVVVTKPWGYVLRAESDEIDLEVFEALVAEAKPLAARERREKLGEALALWRGPALADLAQESALEHESERLEEMRLTALEHRIDADLELGEHEELVPELEALVAADPLRERLRGQLILALYRGGRQGEALETYRETRRVLVDELGIEPSAELRELERAILRQDPALAAAVAAEAPVTAEPPSGRWRWPRSPLAFGVGGLLLLGGLAAGALVLHDGGGGSSKQLPFASWVKLGKPAETTQAVVVSKDEQRGTTGNSGPLHLATHKGRPWKAKHGGTQRPHRPAGAAGVVGAVKVTQTVSGGVPPPAAPPPPPPPAAPPPPPPSVTTADNFNNGVLDPRLWDATTTGGADVANDNRRLELSMSAVLPPHTMPDPIYGRVSTRCKFFGDFYVSVDYSLLDWVPANGVIVMLTASFPGASNTMSIGRSSWTGKDGEGYTSYSPPGWTHLRASDDQRGSLRLTRVGEQLTASYRDQSGWHRLTRFKRSLPTQGGDGPAVLQLQLFSPGGEFGGSAVRVALDNFFASAQRRTCS
jgi:DNA-binding SARP family transcriptional activator